VNTLQRTRPVLAARSVRDYSFAETYPNRIKTNTTF
jgi:hypothetical protein